MKQKSTLAAIFMLLVIVFGLLPAPQPASALTACDWAQFVADVNYPDGTVVASGAGFDKTWRIKNIGTCTWTTSYALVFVSGTQMGAPATQALTASVAPGSTVDITVHLTAPSANGTYRGNFQLQNASATRFGIGSAADKSWWVEIKVGSGGSSTGIAYDFVAFADDPGTTWSSGVGALTFPGTDPDVKGFGKKLVAPITLESGGTDAAPGLLTVPDNNTNGFIQGQYAAFTVQSGDRFQSIINCERNATSCYVNFRLKYQIGSGPVQTFWSFNEKYEGYYYKANLDLSSLAGQSVKFILFVGAAGSPTGDRAVWGGPRITRSGAVTPTPIPSSTSGPTPTTGPTSTPGSGLTDRVTFISDVTIPDGTSFAPSTAFTKTWRIKNTGTSTWTTSYKLVFVSGDQMNGTAEIPLTSTVAPNTSFNISADLTSPAAVGHYRGYWMLKNASGVKFGLGSAADKSWWVDIYVKTTVTPVPSGSMVYDFVGFANDPGTTWSSGAGALTFPGTDPDVKGFAVKIVSPVTLEDGTTDANPGLLTVPDNSTVGFIQGQYPAYTVQSGDRFQSIVNCERNATSCYVNFRLKYQIGSGPIQTFWSFNEKYEGSYYRANISLAPLVGQSVKFILYVGTAGSPTGDRAVWSGPRITR